MKEPACCDPGRSYGIRLCFRMACHAEYGWFDAGGNPSPCCDPAVNPFDKSGQGKAAERNHKGVLQMEKPDHPANAQYPEKVSDGFFSVQVFVDRVRIADSSDHENGNADSDERQGINDYRFADFEQQ